MQLEGAVIREQGQTFAVVVVNSSVGNGGQTACQQAVQSFEPLFPGIPIALMWQDSRGTPTYYGRTDIAKFLANLDIAQIPWKRYTLNIN
jgi:hypothetical protein